MDIHAQSAGPRKPLSSAASDDSPANVGLNVYSRGGPPGLQLLSCSPPPPL